ncbi:MAG: hypothetical protein GX779_05230 [Clostridia bacterium]|nr:hypothetical protein [Clostridia bacterium]
MEDRFGGMMEMGRKAFLLGLGALSMTKEKAEQLVQEMVQKGELSQKEAQDFISKAIDRGREEQKQIKNWFREEIKRILAEAPLVSRAEYEKLEARLARLEAKIGGEQED